MSNDFIKEMRLSSLCVALLTVSTTLSLPISANGQTVQSVVLDIKQPAGSSSTTPTPGNIIVPTVSEPETSPSNSTGQTPTTTPPGIEPVNPPDVPVIPPAGTQSTPRQETPDRIQFDISPPSAPVEDNNPPTLSPPQPTPGIELTPPQAGPTSQPDARVLVAEVQVSGVQGELQDEVYRAIRTQPGRATTRGQLQEDVNAIYATGYFSKVEFVPEDTALGVRVTFVVQPNPVLQNVDVTTVPPEGKRVLPPKVVNDIFASQYGRILNLRNLQEGIKNLNKWYKDNGYDLAQVIDVPQVGTDGRVSLVVAEGVIEDVQVRFINEDGEERDDKDQPIRGRTRQFIITRELQLKPGEVFNKVKAESDLRRLYGLGIFQASRESPSFAFAPGTDPRKVVVVVKVAEKNTGSVAAGAGISSASGLFGTVSYQQQNVGGNDQKLGAELQLGQRELLFDLNFTDPWIAGDPYRTSYTVDAFRRRSISLIFDGGKTDIGLANGDRPRVLRLGGGVTFSRPLSPDPFIDPEWRASLGLQYQRISIRDASGNLTPRDAQGNDLSFSGTGKDDLLTLQLGAVRDRRNNALLPTQGSLLRLGVEQSIPIGQGNIFLNRLRGSYSYYIPVSFTRFSKGPQALAFNLQAGTVLGDLPPYEAFSLGGSNSVRGYEEGYVGSGRSFVQATAEYRFPLFSVIGGALFADFATDLGSGKDVIGDPAGVRGKPGHGFGVGAGVRIQSPLGPIRVDYGFSDQGDSRIHFGIGERF